VPHSSARSCHLAPIASWPDTIRFRYPWSSHLHYVNPINDTPPASCVYGATGWTSLENVLSASVNYTTRLRTQRGEGREWERDMALRMLTHLIGDLHQPLHLTGRERGGNDVVVRFEVSWQALPPRTWAREGGKCERRRAQLTSPNSRLIA